MAEIRKTNPVFVLVVILLLVGCTFAQTPGEPTDSLLFKFKPPDHRVRDVAFSPDGKLLAASYGEGRSACRRAAQDSWKYFS